MSDYRLKVFYSVARRLSFTKAASELFISQPAVTRHIHELEEEYQNKLFERRGNRIFLTDSGRVLLRYTEQLFDIYRKIEFDMGTFAHEHRGLLHLGASTTVSQYVIPPMLASFRQKYPHIHLNLINGNTDQVERALIAGEIEFGIIEGKSKNPEISYTELLKDEIVLVCRHDHPLVRQGEIKPSVLPDIPFVLREQGSGTLEVVEHALRQVNISLLDLRIEINLGSTESIKSYLLYSSCVAFLSVHSVTKELARGDLRVIDVKGLDIKRCFYAIQLHGKMDGLAEILFRFLKHYYNV